MVTDAFFNTFFDSDCHTFFIEYLSLYSPYSQKKAQNYQKSSRDRLQKYHFADTFGRNREYRDSTVQRIQVKSRYTECKMLCLRNYLAIPLSHSRPNSQASVFTNNEYSITSKLFYLDKSISSTTVMYLLQNKSSDCDTRWPP